MSLKRFLFSLVLACAALGLHGQQTIPGFTLTGVNGEVVSLAAYSKNLAVVVIFTGNHCVYSKKYEDRILALAAKYAPKNIQFLLINSNDPELSEDDRLEMMKARAAEKNYPFPYLQDSLRTVAKLFGATHNPQAFILTPAEGGFRILYSGKIDDNPLMEEKVQHHFIAEMLDRILSGTAVAVPPQEMIGCGIKGM